MTGDPYGSANGSRAGLGRLLPVFDSTRMSPARRYNYWLGGKDNFAVDRASGDAIAAAYPSIRTAAIENRRFLERAVTFLAAECSIRQFLDIGTGIPIRPYVHEIASRHHPRSRVVYVDYDPLVAVHARALMTAEPPAVVVSIEADVRQPAAIGKADRLVEVLDLAEPVGLLLVAVLHFLADTDQPSAVVADLAAMLPPGSFVALSHATFDLLPEPLAADLHALADPAGGHGPFYARTRHQVCELIAGLDPIEPGLVPIVDWRSDLPPKPEASPEQAACYGVVARLP